MPSFIVIIAAFVTVVQLIMQAYVPALYKSLGLFIPLIVVNCIVLGRAEAFASKSTVWDSILDGIGMGIGFTLALILIAAIRSGSEAICCRCGRERDNHWERRLNLVNTSPNQTDYAK